MSHNSDTALNMVIGHPLSHTQSPLLHSYLYRRLNLNAVLLAFANETLEPLVTAMKTLAVGLTAVTLPFKEQMLAHLDHCSEAGQALQAVNSVIQRDGQFYGYNTDVDGIAYALRHVTLMDKRVMVIGAGGAARAAGYLLKQKGAHLFWLNRSHERAQRLATTFSGTVVESKEVNTLMPDIIINTTPIGMFPHTDQSPLPDYHFTTEQVVFDMVYHPGETLLLQQAQREGANTIGGVEMFIGQGIRQVALWRTLTLDDEALIDEALIDEARTLLLTEQRQRGGESV